MSNLYTTLHADPFFNRFFVGVDRTFDHLRSLKNDFSEKSSNYPPYNISKINDTSYLIEIALAGFSKEDIEIEQANDKLTIKGSVSKKTDSGELLYVGIAAREFTRTFTLAQDVEVSHAEINNGMLSIVLNVNIPEHKKPRKIAISSAETVKAKKAIAEK